MNITSGQLVTLLTLSRIFMLLTFAIQSTNSLEGSSLLLAVVISSLISMIFVAFCEFVTKQNDLLQSSALTSKWFCKFTALLYFIFCVISAAITASQFEFFLSTTMYSQSHNLIYLFLFIVCAGYCAYTGLTSVGRLSFFVMLAFVVSLCVLTFGLLGDINLNEVVSPFINGTDMLLKGIVRNVGLNTELILIPILAIETKTSQKKISAGFLISSLVFIQLLIFLVLTTLGDYSKTQLFPIFSMMSSANISFLERMDFVYIAIWVFVAVIRTTLYVISAEKVYSVLFNGTNHRGLGLIIGVVLILSLVMIFNIKVLRGSLSLITSSSVIIFMFIIPLINLVATPKGRSLK